MIGGICLNDVFRVTPARTEYWHIPVLQGAAHSRRALAAKNTW